MVARRNDQIDFQNYHFYIIKLASKEKSDNLLRAKSVCLAERPKSHHGRNVRSADSFHRYSDKQYFHRQPTTDHSKRKIKTSNVVVREQKRKTIEKTPCAVSVQNLSIPMTYADNPRLKRSTSKQNTNNYSMRIDNRTKSSNLKQVCDKKLCQTIGGKETENKLLLQISEAEQVSDFERILNSNAILWERAHGHVWRSSVAAHTPSASLLPRPRSTYSLRTVSQAYQTLFRQHEESLQELIDRHRQETTNKNKNATTSLLENSWYENLQGLSEFYEDDQALQKEIETITDRIISDEVRVAEAGQTTTRSNFNVNLAGLIGLYVNGEGVSPTFLEDRGPSPEVERIDDCEVKEWLEPSMSGQPDKYTKDNSDSGIDCLAQNLNTIQIDCDGNVPTITFSNCCDTRSQNDIPTNSEVVIHLAPPSIESVDEARPPMM